MSHGVQRRGAALGVLIFASFMDLLDTTIAQVALPSIRTDLHATDAQLEWVLSGYLLAFAVLLVTGGRLGDRFGRRAVFIVGIGGFTLASAAAAAAENGDALVTSRVVQGAFAALMVPQTLSTLQALYRPRERAAMIGLIGAVSGLAAVVGPLLGGFLVTADVAGLGWRAVFLINVPVGVVVVLLAVVLVPNTRADRAPALDPAGVVLATAAVFALVFPVIEGRSLGWPAWGWVLLAVGVVLAVCLVLVERRRGRRGLDVLLPLTLFRDRGFSAGVVTQAAFQGAMNAITVVLLLYVQAGLGFTALSSGLTLLPFSAGAFAGVALAIPLIPRLGKALLTVGATVQALGVLVVLGLVVGTGGSLTGWTIAAPLFVMGTGLSLLVVPLVDVALATVPTSEAGAASGVYSTFQQLGAAAGIAVSGAVFFGVVGARFDRAALEDGLLASAWVSVAGYGLAALASVLLPSRRQVQAHLDAAQAELERVDPVAAAAG
jgi:EmrB/QacA subfamily drug resistance transporter